jgi:hypothetical protein
MWLSVRASLPSTANSVTCQLDRPPKLIALANAALPDSDRRKITREKLATIRLALDLLPRADDEDVMAHQAANEFVDGLESYLPPPPRAHGPAATCPAAADP